MAMKRVSDPQISPSGKWVMFSVTDVSLEKNTKVNHLVGGGDRREDAGAAGYVWRWGGEWAVFAGWEDGLADDEGSDLRDAVG